MKGARKPAKLARAMTAAADNEPKERGIAGRALGWWLGELRALWGDAARRLDRHDRNALFIEAGERYWILRQNQRPLGQVDRATADADETRRLLQRLPPALRKAPVVVEIPQERALVRRIALPAMARNELDRVLHFEIARHFPFPAERVHFSYRVAARGALQGSGIEVELVAVPREIVGEICAELARAGLRPSRIVVGTAAGTEPLALPVAAMGRRASRLSGTDRALLLALVVLALAALASPIVQHRLRLAAVAGEIDTLRPQVQSIVEARDRERRATERIAAPLRLMASRPPLVAVLDDLTKAVPDGSWLLSLSLSGREMVMDGLSPSAAATALALEQSNVFTNVVFRSPITREPQSGLEHFQFSATIAERKP